VQPTASHQSTPASKLHQNLPTQCNCEMEINHFNQLILRGLHTYLLLPVPTQLS
jgi:hypothetical protein